MIRPGEGVAFMPARYSCDMDEQGVMIFQAEPPTWTLEAVAALLQCKPHEIEDWSADGWALRVKMRPPTPGAIVRMDFTKDRL